MKRGFSNDFPDVLDLQEPPFLSDENVTKARLIRPLPLKWPDCVLKYDACPVFKYGSERDAFGNLIRHEKGWRFNLRSVRNVGDVSFCPHFDYEILDVKKERLDTDCFLYQFLAPTFERGQCLVRSFGVRFEIGISEPRLL